MSETLLHGEGIIPAILLLIVVFLILQVGVVIVAALWLQRHFSKREEEKLTQGK